jgi:hypothetical protein
MAENKRGWNFRKGGKDAPSAETLKERARKGGQAKVSKGFADKEVYDKAIKTRRENAKNGEKSA